VNAATEKFAEDSATGQRCRQDEQKTCRARADAHRVWLQCAVSGLRNWTADGLHLATIHRMAVTNAL
jgi:hypothetical protein